jgi:hypothetical protein
MKINETALRKIIREELINETVGGESDKTVARVDAAFDKLVEWVADGLEGWVADHSEMTSNNGFELQTADAAWDLANGAMHTFPTEARIILQHEHDSSDPPLKRQELIGYITDNIAEAALDEYEARSIGK